MNDANLGNEKKFEKVFESFVRSGSSRQIKKTFDTLLDHLDIHSRQVYLHGHQQSKRVCSTRLVYKIIKSRTDYWKSNELWKKYDKKASGPEYANKSQGSERPLRVLIIGSGPVGLRLSIECALLGFQCTVVEKRDRFSRNNVLHLWPYTIHDLKSLGAKLFYGKFCAGSIDHISIRKLQCVLLKVALLLGVQVHFNTSFERLVEPENGGGGDGGWRIKCIPESHVVAAEAFDAVIGADGRRNSLPGFMRKEFRGRLAIGITVNFINNNTLDEQNVEERSGVAFIFDQKFFLDLKRETGIDLENIVYYKDDTHYFVMTAKRQSLLEKQVIKEDYSDAVQLLSKDNVNFENLCAYAKEAAYHSTSKKLTTLHFAKNHYGQPDVAMFDFTSLFHSENASRIVVRNGHSLLMSLVGDSLLEPFWPLGTGIARGFLAALDTAWQLRGYADGRPPLQLLAERESVYQLLSQTTHDNIGKSYHEFTIDPSTRYCSLSSVKRGGQLSEEQVAVLYDDGSEPIYSPKAGEHSILVMNCGKVAPKRARIHNSATTLLHWAQMVVQPFSMRIEGFYSDAWKDGSVLLAIVSRYKADYVDYKQLEQQNETKQNLLTLFNIIEQKLGLLVEDWAKEDFFNEDKQPSKSSVLTILDKLYECFKNDPIMDDRSEMETECEDSNRVLAKRRRPMTILDNESVPEEIKEPIGLRRRGSLVKSAVFQNRIDFFNNNASQSEIERKASFNKPKAEFEMFESRPVCYKCGLRISKADTVSLFDGIVLHANCFRCQDCNRQLRPICFKHTVNQNNRYTFFCNNHVQKDARKNLFDDDNFDKIGQVQSVSRFGECESPHKPDVALDTSDYFNELQRDKFEKRCNFYLSSYQTKRPATSDSSSNYTTPNTSFTGALDDAETPPYKLRERAEFESILEFEECNNSKEEEEEPEEKANLDDNIFTDSEDQSQSDNDDDHHQHFYSIDTKYITLRNTAQQSITPSTSKSKSQSPYSSTSELSNKIIENQLNEQVDVYLMRKRAQEKAKLKSDEELGLNSTIVIKRVASSGDEYEDVFNSPPEIKRQSFDFNSAAPLAKSETLDDDDHDPEPKRTLVKADLKLSLGSESSSSNDEFSSSSLVESFNALNVDNSPRLKRSAINRKRVMNEEKKIVKQNQDRLRRMSQQLQRKLDELRHKKDELSENVSGLEKRINGLDVHSLCFESVKKTLEAKLLNCIHCKNMLLRIENELIIQSEALAIEDRLSECQLKLKETIDLPEEKKSGQIREKEKWLMERLVDFIEEKDRLVDQLEKLKMMESEEDKFVMDILSKETSQDFIRSSNDLFQQFKSFNDII